MQDHLPFHEMEPMDELVSDESTLTVGEGDGVASEMGAQVFAKPREVYAIYFPVSESTGTIDLGNVSGDFSLKWYNPRTGEFVGDSKTLSGGAEVAIDPPPSTPEEDWVALIQK